jgi:VanZ family protein
MDDGARRSWTLALGVAAAVLVASVVPPTVAADALEALPSPSGPPASEWSPPSPVPQDKLWHAAIYAGLAGVTLRATLRSPRIRRPFAVAVVGAAGYGLAIEGVQSQLAWRTGDPLDAAANAVGAALVAAVVLAVRIGRHRGGWP